MNSQANRNTWYSDLFWRLPPGWRRKNKTCWVCSMKPFNHSTVWILISKLELPDDDAPLGSRLAALKRLVSRPGFWPRCFWSDRWKNWEINPQIVRNIWLMCYKSVKLMILNCKPVDDDDNNYEELVEYLRMGLFFTLWRIASRRPWRHKNWALMTKKEFAKRRQKLMEIMGPE